MLNAEKAKQTVHGIELGKFGTFTLRVVHPWMIDGIHTGYIELGMEIEHITSKLQKMLEADLIFLIDKRRLNRDDWEEGMRMMGKKGSWDLLQDFAIIDSTLAEIPEEIHAYLMTSRAKQDDMFFSHNEGYKKYRAGSVQLLDAGKNDVGDIIVSLLPIPVAAQFIEPPDA